MYIPTDWVSWRWYGKVNIVINQWSTDTDNDVTTCRHCIKIYWILYYDVHIYVESCCWNMVSKMQDMVYHIILMCLLQMAKAASSEKKLHFVENFGLSGAAAIISKTAAAPIERVKLLVQNQDEMLKSGRLETPYKGVVDCTMRTYRAEGFVAFWRGE